jgi:Ca-activated chloride channel family protein
VRLEGALDRDFVVTVGGLQARPLVRLARDADGWVALASFLPPAPTAPAPERGLRVKLLVDCSGSMAGDSIGQARRAVARLLERLGTRDRIDLSRFGSTVRHLSAMEAATPAHLARCHRWARELEADLGGTEMLGALREVFARGEADDEGADVFLITDGEVHQADEIVALARRHRQRVFVVGVGSAPNESLLQRLAAGTGGAAELVTPNESIEDALMRLFARLRQPRVTGLAVDWPLAPDWTAPLPPALWSGETAHVMARFAARPAGESTLRWTEAGASRSVAVMLAAADEAGTLAAADEAGLLPRRNGEDRAPPREDAVAPPDDALPRLAAGLAVAALPEAQRGAFAERYQLVTDLTSMALVMLRDGARAQALPTQVKVAQMLAAGWGGYGMVVCASASHAPESPMRTGIDAGGGADDGTAAIWRMPSGSAARMRAFPEASEPARGPLEALATDVAEVLADAGRGQRAVAPGLSLPALYPVLPPALTHALENALSASAADAPGEVPLIAWLVLELARRCPAVRFPRAALRELRALARGVTPPRPVLEALDALASQATPPGRFDIPAFLRRG